MAMAKSSNSQFLKRVGLRIKQLRKEKDITQEDFYNDTGIHVGRIETAQRDFSMTTLNKICKYLDVSLSDFFKDLK
jgi:transcriptional regulator with XRE-family HTH domain